MSNPFKMKGRWYKGNLHTHTAASDGDTSPEEVVTWYKDRGYDFLAITDHDKITSIKESPSDFLLIKGAEIGGGEAELGQSYHLVCLNISEIPEFEKESTAQEMIDIVKKAGGKVIIGHPYWCALVLNDLTLKGTLGIEIFNSCCDLGIGKGHSNVHWDNLLVRGNKVYGFAVDDSHYFTSEPCDPGRGWIMVKAEHLTKEGILEAVEKGMFYSSCGPIIENISIGENGAIRASCSPVARINFVCNSSKGRVFRAEGDNSLTEAEVVLGDVMYVRVECIDAKGLKAWSNPFFLTK